MIGRIDLADIGVDDDGAVQFNFDGVALDDDVLEIPLAHGRR